MPRKNLTFIITNLVALAALFAGVINVITFREMWILIAAVAVMIVITTYTIREKRKLINERRTQSQGSL